MKRGQIIYLVGDATNPTDTGGIRIIAHICNDAGKWGKGFVKALSARWKEPEEAYRQWSKSIINPGQPFILGSVQFVEVEPNLWVANMIAQHGISPDAQGLPPIRYGVLDHCLGTVRDRAKELNASVHMPRIGTGLAMGKWKIVEQIIENEVSDRGVDVYVYDLPAWLWM